jgi:hypothetical protein
MPGLRVSQGIVGVLLESSPFTYNEPTASDAWPAFDISAEFSGESFQRSETKSHFSRYPEIPGMAEGTISFKVLAVGASGVATAPYYKNALAGAGFRQEITAATNVTYKPWSTYDAATGAGPPAFINPAASYTVALGENGVQYAIKGAAGTCKLVGSSGKPLQWEFTFKGAYVAPAADTNPAITATALVPSAFLGATLSVHALAAVFTDFTLDIGNELQPSVNANDAAGIRGYICTNRSPIATVNPEMELPATHDFFGKWRSGVTGALSFGPVNSGTGNRIALSAAAVQYRAPKMGERAGARSLDIEMPIVSTGAEGADFSIIFT